MKVVNYCVICGTDNVDHMPGILFPFLADRIWGWKPTEMQNIDGKTLLAYPICGSIKCKNCGYIGCDIRFDDDEMGRLYSGYRDERYTALRAQYEPGYAELNHELENKPVDYLDKIEAFILSNAPRPKRVMDWGGNNGINTPFKDAEIDIYDVTDKPPVFGRLVAQPNPPYDLIVCSNVMEHLPYPKKVMRELRGYMEPDTLLFLEIPLEKREYLAWHEHINRFTEQSIKELVRLSGFTLTSLMLLPPPRHGYENICLVLCKVAI